MNKDCASSLLQFMDQDRYEGSLVVQNPSYRLQLKRKSCDGEWVLTSVDRNVNELGLEAAMSAKTQVQQILHYAFKIYDLSVPDILSEKNGSKVDRISAVTRDGKELVQVDFDATHPVKAPEGGVFSPTQGGTFWLDPSRHWCVVEYKLRAEWGGQTKVTIESSWLVRTSHCRTSGKRTFARVGNSCRLRSCGPWMPAVVDRKKCARLGLPNSDRTLLWGGPGHGTAVDLRRAARYNAFTLVSTKRMRSAGPSPRQLPRCAEKQRIQRHRGCPRLECTQKGLIRAEETINWTEWCASKPP